MFGFGGGGFGGGGFGGGGMDPAWLERLRMMGGGGPMAGAPPMGADPMAMGANPMGPPNPEAVAGPMAPRPSMSADQIAASPGAQPKWRDKLGSAWEAYRNPSDNRMAASRALLDFGAGLMSRKHGESAGAAASRGIGRATAGYDDQRRKGREAKLRAYYKGKASAAEDPEAAEFYELAAGQTDPTPVGMAGLGFGLESELGRGTLAERIRGEDVRANTSRHSIDTGSATIRRGQDIGSATRRRGQDFGLQTADRDRDLRTGEFYGREADRLFRERVENRNYHEGVRRYDEGFGESRRVGDRAYGEGVRRYDQDFGEGQRRYDFSRSDQREQFGADLGFRRQGLAQEQSQFEDSLAEAKRAQDSAQTWTEKREAASRVHQLEMQGHDLAYQREVLGNRRDEWQETSALSWAQHHGNMANVNRQLGMQQARDGRVGDQRDRSLDMQEEGMADSRSQWQQTFDQVTDERATSDYQWQQSFDQGADHFSRSLMSSEQQAGLDREERFTRDMFNQEAAGGRQQAALEDAREGRNFNRETQVYLQASANDSRLELARMGNAMTPTERSEATQNYIYSQARMALGGYAPARAELGRLGLLVDGQVPEGLRGMLDAMDKADLAQRILTPGGGTLRNR